jgi:hypothetical protein
MTDAGKAALYLRSILEELQLEPLHPTGIQVDNRGARQLTNAQQPTRQTRHIDMRDFCILQWTKEELILYTDVPSANNVSDSLSKPTGRIKFYEHMDILMGRQKPAYVQSLHHPSILSTYSNLTPFDISLFLDGLDSVSVGGCEDDV